uniref:Sushi, nidogen and EGF-like domain-containing protein 1 n=1 Tax=Magallana gigas TaxID=29159 RepID=K1QM71_MAGGI
MMHRGRRRNRRGGRVRPPVADSLNITAPPTQAAQFSPGSSGVSTYTPDPFPIANDARMIAPFWADIDTTRGGAVWYRETTNADLLDRTTKEVTNNYPNFFRFKASWIFIATWDRVAFYGCAGVGCSKTNTFQAVLITNGQHSFTIYNYEDIQWTTGTASGGNSTTGIGGTPAQVGFNAGDGIVSFTVNASRSPDIVNVDKHSNVDIPGKFAFRIDASDISDGGCNTEGNLTIAPRYGPMLGGQYLIISGPCIEQNATIKVSFSGSPQKECERKSEFAFACITPLFSHTGDTPVKVEIKNQEGESRIFQGLYTVLNLADCKHQVHRHDASDWFSGRQQISWDPDVAELQEDDFVNIHLLFVAKFNERLVLKWYNPKNGIESLKNTGTTKYNLPDPKNNYAMAIRVTAAPQRENQQASLKFRK